MNLVTSPGNLQSDKPKLAVLLSNTTFNKGHTYAEYLPGIDKAAGYGLAGLILGGGAVGLAAKTGLLAAICKWGLGLVLLLKNIVVAVFAALFKLIWVAFVAFLWPLQMP